MVFGETHSHKQLMNRYLLEYRNAQNGENRVHARFECELLPYNEQKRVYSDGTPDLYIHRVGLPAEECLDAQIHLDPFEEQLDSPAGFVELGNGEGRQSEVVREKAEALAGVGIDVDDPSQLARIRRLGIDSGEADNLIANQAAAFRHRPGVTTVEAEVGFAARYKEGVCLMNACEPLEVEVAAINNIEAPSLEGESIEPVDVMHLSIRDMDECRDWSPQIQLGMHLDRGFGFAETRPREQRQTQLDGGRVDSVDGGVEILDVERLSGIELARPFDEQQGQVPIDAPVPRDVGVGERAACHGTAETEVIELVDFRSQAVFDFAQTLAKGELGEGQCQQMIPAGQPGGFIFAFIARNNASKVAFREKVDDLREYIASCMHGAMLSPQNRDKMTLLEAIE